MWHGSSITCLNARRPSRTSTKAPDCRTIPGTHKPLKAQELTAQYSEINSSKKLDLPNTPRHCSVACPLLSWFLFPFFPETASDWQVIMVPACRFKWCNVEHLLTKCFIEATCRGAKALHSPVQLVSGRALIPLLDVYQWLVPLARRDCFCEHVQKARRLDAVVSGAMENGKKAPYWSVL